MRADLRQFREARADAFYYATRQIPDVTVLTPPEISGTLGIGEDLTAAPGSYLDASGVSGQWVRDGVPIAGATATAYTQVAADIGASLAYVETASNAASSVSTTSNALRWDPDDFSPNAWLDASAPGVLWQDDAGTVPADATDDPIGRWDESQTGGGFWTQSIAANRPERQVDGGIRADGNDDYLNRNASLIVDTTEGVTYYWAFVLTPSEPAQTVPMLFDESAYALRGPTLGLGTGGFLVSFGNTSTPNVNSVAGQVFMAGQVYLFEVEVKILAGDVGTIKAWIDGVISLDTTGDFSGNDAVIGLPARLFMQRKSLNMTRSHRGSLFELLYFDTPDPAVPANLRAYLQNKWGL